MPLRARLALAVVLSAAAIAAIGGYLFVHELRVGLYRSVDVDLRNRAADAVTEANDSDPGVSHAAPALPDNEPLAQIVTASGRVLASTSSVGAAPLVSTTQLAALHRGAGAFTARDGSARVLAQRFIFRGDPVYAVIGTRLAPTNSAIDRVQEQVVLAGSLIVVFAGVAGWFIAGGALRPVEQLRQQVASLEADDLTDVDVPPRRDELAKLARTMNELLTRVRRSRRREQVFIAEASHELRTPLTILRGELELAARPGRTLKELTAAVAIASEETDRISRLAEDLLLLARTDTGTLPLRFAPVAPVEIANSSAARGGAAGAANHISVTVSGDASLVVRADPDRLRQAVDNLVINALRFAPPNSIITITVAAHGGTWSLSVADDGPGLAADILERAFEPFAKGVKAGRRSNSEAAGLGLAIVEAISNAHNGTVQAVNRPEGGAVVRFDLPTHPEKAAAITKPLPRTSSTPA